MGIEIGGEIKEYVVNEKGELTSIAPFYWGNLSPEVSVNAWFPYNEGKSQRVSLWLLIKVLLRIIGQVIYWR